MSLKSKTAAGIFWSLIQNVGIRFIQFIVNVVLARLLSPGDFGLMAMTTLFVSLSLSLTNAGFRQGLIRKQNADEEDYASVFYINLGVSIILYLIIFFTAPFIAAFFKQPLLTAILRVLMLIFIFNGFSYIQETLLLKKMEFKRLMIIQIPSTIIAGIISIVMAYLGYGVWSIVAFQLSSRVIYAIQIWVFSKWRPLLVFNKQKAKGLFSYGSKLMFSGIINTIYQNVYAVIIGKFYTVSSLGYYQNANNLVQYPSGTILTALNSVSFSTFSVIKSDDNYLKQGYRKMIEQLFFWLCPAFTFVAIVAEPLFNFLFSAKWLPAVPYFQALCATGILYPLTIYNKNIINIKGKSGLYLKLTIIEKVFASIGIIIAVHYGIKALVAMQILTALFAYLINSYCSGIFIKYTLLDELKNIFPILLLTIAVGIVIIFLDKLLINFTDIFRVSLSLITGVLLYLFAAKQLGFAPYKELIGLVQGRLKQFAH